jgi:AAA domain
LSRSSALEDERVSRRPQRSSCFVVVSGLPGSGKTTLADKLGPALSLPVIDKDQILYRLFEPKGVGDAMWRRVLSRESDSIFERRAASSDGAILVSFWRLPGMTADSGTPTGWLKNISGTVVNVHCICEPELAAERFQRKRHPGHLDSRGSYQELLGTLRNLSRLVVCPTNILPYVERFADSETGTGFTRRRARGSFVPLVLRTPR